jgi:peptidoglycan/xylan/chitin deacetylase (PgdA/CDA1 family)
MKAFHARCGIAALLALLTTGLPLFAQTSSPKAIAITIDDLPAGAANTMTGGEILEMTRKLLSTLHQQNVPAVGFVNEEKLYKMGEVDDRISALRLWLDNGFELGNHTFAHTSLNRVTLEAWEEDVVRGETVTRMLLAQHNRKLRYLRHPYLDAGRDLQTRREAEAFLSSRGYQVAPVTMDAWDWMYAGVYADARRRGDVAMEQQLVSSYLSYTTAVFDYYEKLSRELFGYEPKQILLLHGNWLEAEHIGELIELLRKRGYSFVTLEDALGDGAYSTPDEYVGEGTGWVDHWADTRGKPAQNAPAFPQWVIDKANEIHRAPAGPAPY